MESWWERAIAEPWAFVALAMGAGIFFFVRWLGNKFFDEERGIATKFLAAIREDSQNMKNTMAECNTKVSEDMARMAEGIENNTGSIQTLGVQVGELERQLVSAIQAKPDDEELFNVLFMQNPIPICFVGPDYKFTRLNKACEELWGYSAGELSRMTFADVTTEKDLAADLENVQRVARGSLERYRMEKRYKCKDGSMVRCALYVFRYPTTGAFLHFISIIVPLNG